MSPDGAAVPFFIDWLDCEHPTASLPASVALASLTAYHPEPDRLGSLPAALGAPGVHVTGGSPSVTAALTSPHGPVDLR